MMRVLLDLVLYLRKQLLECVRSALRDALTDASGARQELATIVH